MEYQCSKCGKSVKIIDNKMIKNCNCNEPVIINISANTHGTSIIKGN